MKSPAQEIEDLVEELRASGYHGRDEAIANAPRRTGTLATAARQLEVAAEQISSAWLDGDMDDRELWQVITGNFGGTISALADIIESTLPPVPHETSLEFYGAWLGTKRLTRRASADVVEVIGPGNWVVSLLTAAMVLRQCGQLCLSPEVSPTFRSGSTNVAPEFFDRCTDTLGWRPFGAADGVPLSELAERIAEPQLHSSKPADEP